MTHDTHPAENDAACMCGEPESTHGWGDPPHMFTPQGHDADAPTGCHPLMVCTDRPELCPPVCRPVVRNAGANVILPVVSEQEAGQ